MKALPFNWSEMDFVCRTDCMCMHKCVVSYLWITYICALYWNTEFVATVTGKYVIQISNCYLFTYSLYKNATKLFRTDRISVSAVSVHTQFYRTSKIASILKASILYKASILSIFSSILFNDPIFYKASSDWLLLIWVNDGGLWFAGEYMKV